MAAIDRLAFAHAGPLSGASALVSHIGDAFRAIRTQIAYRRTLDALQSLSSRQLADIGLEDTDLRSVARRMAQANTH